MVGVDCCRRRRVRPAIQYLLIAFCLLNFCLAVAFFQRFYGDPRSSDVPVVDSSYAEAERDDWPNPTMVLPAYASLVPHGDDFHVEHDGDGNDFPDYEVVNKKTEVKTNPTNKSALLLTNHHLAQSHPQGVTSTTRSFLEPAPESETRRLLKKLSGSLDVELLATYEDRSRKPMLYNWHLLKNEGASVDIIVAVQIHDRASYLAYLFDSFRLVRSWENTVIVLSHDYYSPEIDTLVKSCTFAPIIAIYYPASNQIFKHRYPGEDPRDCTRDMTVSSAKTKGCYNANYPDTYGHYREARFSQTKLHWIWKLHYIFDEVVPRLFPKFTGRVLLLEEDHYVSPDFLHVVRLAERLQANYRIITIGNYKDMRFGNHASRFALNKWVSSRLNMGMSLTGDTWKLIKGCVRTFCDFDDYNWDWSLQFTAINCIEGNLYTLYARSSRVFHIGECAGIHFKNKCIASEKVESIKQKLTNNADTLFPSYVTIEDSVPSIAQLKPKPNGGWGDPRDRMLCRAVATGSFLDIVKSVRRAQTEPI